MNIRQSIGKINIDGTLAFDEPMSRHTSFKVGGPADVFLTPSCIQDIKLIREYAWNEDLPIFPLGAGANILVSDKGIRGIAVDTSRLHDIHVRGQCIHAACGASMSDVSNKALSASLEGLAFIYGMPGSVGGSVWMNARCYGTSLSDVLGYVDVLNDSNENTRISINQNDFSYKHSPFMESENFIVAAGFSLEPGNAHNLRLEMESHRSDRESKGHFSSPCAGSIFKNNHAFGQPTGEIIDELGLKNKRIGGALVSPLHGNIVISDGTATATDILTLIELIEHEVFSKRGYVLEREVIPVGDWE